MEQTQEDLELTSAMERLSQAKQKKAAADEQKLSAARAAIAEREAAEVRKRAEELAAYQAMVAMHERKRAEKAVAEEAARRQADAEKATLDRLLAEQEEVKRKREAREKEIQLISEQAYMLEVAAQQVMADAMRAEQPKEEPKPPSLATTPLGFLFSGQERTAYVEPAPAPIQEPQLPPERRKENPEEMRHIEWLFQMAKSHISSLQAKQLLAIWEPVAIGQAIATLGQGATAQAVEIELGRTK